MTREAFYPDVALFGFAGEHLPSGAQPTSLPDLLLICTRAIRRTAADRNCLNPLDEVFGNTRDATGQISSIETGFLNLGLVEFAGLQSSLSWMTELGRYGDLNLSLNHLYTDQQHETPGSGNTVRLEGTIGRSKHRVTATAGWTIGDWTLFNQFRWLDGAVFSNEDDEFSRTIAGVGSWFVMDTSILYALNDNIEFQLNIDNLLDREMPYPAAASGFGETTYFSGIMGRYATFTARARF